LLGVAHPERFERIVVFNAPPLWVPLSPRVIASLWRTWYVAAAAGPLGPAIVASDRFVPWFIRLGGRACGSSSCPAVSALQAPNGLFCSVG
jgi:hypothetical protein